MTETRSKELDTVKKYLSNEMSDKYDIETSDNTCLSAQLCSPIITDRNGVHEGNKEVVISLCKSTGEKDDGFQSTILTGAQLLKLEKVLLELYSKLIDDDD